MKCFNGHYFLKQRVVNCSLQIALDSQNAVAPYLKGKELLHFDIT